MVETEAAAANLIISAADRGQFPEDGGACEVAFSFHVDRGDYGGVTLDGLNVALIARTPGAMADGNWSVALYLDERADEQQRQALQAVFTGSVGGPVAALAPLISTVLGVKPVPITFRK